MTNTQIWMICIVVVVIIFCIIGGSWYAGYKKRHPELFKDDKK